MTAAQYDRVIAKLQAAGADTPPGRTDHSSFGEPNNLMVFDVWDSAAQFEAFGETLMPILAELGLDTGEPEIMSVHNIIAGERPLGLLAPPARRSRGVPAA